MEWPCEHIGLRDGEGYIKSKDGRFYGKVDESIFYCAKCGAKRPEKPKTLAERLQQANLEEARENEVSTFSSGWKATAEEAVKFCEEVVDEFWAHNSIYTISDLKQFLRKKAGL